MADGRQGSTNGDGTARSAGTAGHSGGESAGGDAGSLESALADLFAVDGDDVGALLMGQLEALVDSWAKVIEVVAHHGIDPTPLLQTLAGTLRATADQLDPSVRHAPGDP